MSTLSNVKPRRDREKSPCYRVYLRCLPRSSEAVSGRELRYRGVHQKCAVGKASLHINPQESDASHWYALRTTYGREKKAYNYLTEKGMIAFYPTFTVMKQVDGKRKQGRRRIPHPNIFFAYGRGRRKKSLFRLRQCKPSLSSFYYRHVDIGKASGKEPLTVPDDQMKSLRIISKAEAEDVVVSTDNIPVWLRLMCRGRL